MITNLIGYSRKPIFNTYNNIEYNNNKCKLVIYCSFWDLAVLELFCETLIFQQQ